MEGRGGNGKAWEAWHPWFACPSPCAWQMYGAQRQSRREALFVRTTCPPRRLQTHIHSPTPSLADTPTQGNTHCPAGTPRQQTPSLLSQSWPLLAVTRRNRCPSVAQGSLSLCLVLLSVSRPASVCAVKRGPRLTLALLYLLSRVYSSSIDCWAASVAGQPSLTWAQEGKRAE